MLKVKTTIKLDSSRLRQKLSKAFDATADELNNELRLAFDDPIWNWSGVTKRRNGEVVASPRDILDTTTLRDSQALQRINDFAVRYTWSAQYAASVFAGSETKSGTFIAARNLPRYVLFNSGYSFLKQFAARAKTAFG
jgi:hypothetical protein